MITLTNLEKVYRTKEIETVALENVNLTVDKGEFLSIMGPSGCGKSTLLNIMGLLDQPTRGYKPHRWTINNWRPSVTRHWALSSSLSI